MLSSFCRKYEARFWAYSRACASLSNATRVLPASGTSDKPTICATLEGVRDFTGLPISSFIARMRPNAVPATTESPTCNVPLCTMIVATGPLPFSKLPSNTTAFALPSFAAFSSKSWACMRIVSNSVSTPIPVLADIGINSYSPPHSFGVNPSSAHSALSLSGLTFSLSILFIAIIICTPAALA